MARFGAGASLAEVEQGHRSRNGLEPMAVGWRLWTGAIMLSAYVLTEHCGSGDGSRGAWEVIFVATHRHWWTLLTSGLASLRLTRTRSRSARMARCGPGATTRPINWAMAPAL